MFPKIFPFSDFKYKRTFLYSFHKISSLFKCLVQNHIYVITNYFSSVRGVSSIQCNMGALILHKSSVHYFVSNKIFLFLHSKLGFWTASFGITMPLPISMSHFSSCVKILPRFLNYSPYLIGISSSFIFLLTSYFDITKLTLTRFIYSRTTINWRVIHMNIVSFTHPPMRAIA